MLISLPSRTSPRTGDPHVLPPLRNSESAGTQILQELRDCDQCFRRLEASLDSCCVGSLPIRFASRLFTCVHCGGPFGYRNAADVRVPRRAAADYYVTADCGARRASNEPLEEPGESEPGLDRESGRLQPQGMFSSIQAAQRCEWKIILVGVETTHQLSSSRPAGRGLGYSLPADCAYGRLFRPHLPVHANRQFKLHTRDDVSGCVCGAAGYTDSVF